jgi:hypothetical protein
MSRSHKLNRKWFDSEDNEEILHRTRTQRLDNYYQMVKEDNEALYTKAELEELEEIDELIEEELYSL